MIYRNSYRNGITPLADPGADLAENFGRMLGWTDEGFFDLLRLYLNIHCDHESGNVSAHTTHLVGSALCDVFKSYAAGLNGLAGPLHGLANQECLKWLMDLWKHVGDHPSNRDIEEYAKRYLATGKVIPGYGHAVLRITDPRFTSQMDFAKEMLPDNVLCNIVAKCYEVIPRVLKEQGKDLIFPGGAPLILEAVDADLQARAIAWAGESPNARNQAFNLTNGDQFVWEHVWPAIADSLGMKPGPRVPQSLEATTAKETAAWDAIRAKYKLTAPQITQYVGESFQYADFCFAYGHEPETASWGSAAIVSTIKIKQAGFTEVMDTEAMFRKWFKLFQDEKLLPPR